MTIKINTKGFSKTGALQNFIMENILQATRGFRKTDHERINILLESASKAGKKGNLYTCKVLYSTYSVIIRQTHSNMYGAIEKACDLLRRRIGKLNKRKHQFWIKPLKFNPFL